MADTNTSPYDLTLPQVGASADTWGTKLNDNLEKIDNLLDGTLTVQGVKLDSNLTIVDTTDDTKVVTVDVAGVTTGTLRTWTFPDASDTFVGRTATQTLTNKTLTTPAISTISNSGTVTLPTGTDTLVGRATTDTLTNKTMDFSANTVTVDGTNAPGFLDIPSAGTKTGSYTLATGDVGKYVQIDTGGAVTIPDATFSQGDVISIFNNTSGQITITCTITTAYVSGFDTDRATVGLLARGVCTVLFSSGTVCVISGAVA